MDRFHSWELGTSDNDTCETCGMPTSDADGCCRNEVKIVKLQQDLLGAKSMAISFSMPDMVVGINSVLIAPFYNWNRLARPENSGPPLLITRETYLENCVFRL